ncbi:MAG: hypothetical protein IPQ05_21735 [Leptospiraceae bacterium]|nr:hypothetical protein [Leptospiraceae bacterium]MBP6740879.1 hypothetical protein [Leptospiraceae bacterium]
MSMAVGFKKLTDEELRQLSKEDMKEYIAWFNDRLDKMVIESYDSRKKASDLLKELFDEEDS